VKCGYNHWYDVTITLQYIVKIDHCFTILLQHHINNWSTFHQHLTLNTLLKCYKNTKYMKVTSLRCTCITLYWIGNILIHHLPSLCYHCTCSYLKLSSFDKVLFTYCGRIVFCASWYVYVTSLVKLHAIMYSPIEQLLQLGLFYNLEVRDKHHFGLVLCWTFISHFRLKNLCEYDYLIPLCMYQLLWGCCLFMFILGIPSKHVSCYIDSPDMFIWRTFEY
jgi:hypothetical protein